ncbi:acyloxyacyl hydrolase [Desulfosarcina sp.]|uniref:acyloxyacyl hydrolase n=1 Tax=Desulfosarcina sp. TaxID=2027861 RepID=UPI003562BA95
MIATHAPHRCCCNRRRLLCTGIWTWVIFSMMAAGGYPFEPPSPTGPVRALRVGMLAHDVDGLWSGESKEEGPDLCIEVIFNRPLFHLLTATAYPEAGVSLNTQGDTSKMYGGFLLRWEPESSFFFSTGLGLALHDGQRHSDSANRKALGSRVLFRIPIEIGYAVNYHHRIMLAFAHASNAGLASPNEGLDTLGLVYEYRY